MSLTFPALIGAREGEAAPGQTLPLVVEPDGSGTGLLDLASRNRAGLRQRLLHHGGILFRGFPGAAPESFRGLMSALSGEPLPYVERSSPRHEVGDRVYTSTDHPAAQEIFLHNEQSYNLTWPLRIAFYCDQAPGAGGGTPIADCRRVLRRISEATRDRLEERSYCYARHFGGALGLNWREAFQTDDRATVERYCEDHGISHAWGPRDTLTTRQIRPVSARHPMSEETTWFNHLLFFNVRLFDPGTVKALMSLGKENLPNNTYYGDGSDIEPEVVEELRAAYLAEKVVVPWRQGDMLLLDNMLTAHARESFTPPRRIIVAMTEPHTAADKGRTS